MYGNWTENVVLWRNYLRIIYGAYLFNKSPKSVFEILINYNYYKDLFTNKDIHTFINGVV